MKSIIYDKFGAPEVLKIREEKKPEPKDNEVLIRVHAATINSGDLHMRSGNPFIARLFAGPIIPRNKVLGTTLSGEVVGKGKGVTLFDIGDQVFGSLGIVSGTHTEYLVMSEDGSLVKKPSNVSHEAAATLSFGPQTAKYFLEKANVKAGMRVLVLGASGSVGSSVVQLAKTYKVEVTGVCSSKMSEFVKMLGADQVVDYNKENILDKNDSYDIIFDTSSKYPISKLMKKLNQGGTYISLEMNLSLVCHMLIPKSNKRKIIFDVSKVTNEDLNFLGQLTESGKYKALIERVYVMDEFYEAHTHAEQSSKKGSIVLKMHG